MNRRESNRRKSRRSAARRQGAFAPDPIPRYAGPPASSTPLQDLFAEGHPGMDDGYAVLPRSLVESMPLPWQQQLTALLSQFHQAYGHLTWPVYHVVPSRYERLVDLDEEQLAAVGCTVEIDPDGSLVYQDRSGRVIPDAEAQQVLVPCLDPIPKHTDGHVPPAPPHRA